MTVDTMRKDDVDLKHFFQTDRFFRIGDQWWFTAREGGDHGPFRSREHAEKALLRHIDTIQGFKSLKVEREERREGIDKAGPRVDRTIWDHQSDT